MEVDVLIIGQGISGTLLSWFLHKEGKTFLVLDKASGSTASKVAAGLVNPVTGRRYSITWMVDTLHPFAKSVYGEMETFLNTSLLYPRTIIEFFPSPQMRDSFVDRISENDTYLHPYPDQNLFNPFFHYDFGCGEIKPAFSVHLQLLLSLWRRQLEQWNCLRQEDFDEKALQLEPDGIRYQGIGAKKIIFCNGIAAAESSPFHLLPFSANKGEALIIRCDDLKRDHIYKRKMMLVPLPEENLFWFGSNYQWEYADDRPTPAFYEAACDTLNAWLKPPFTIEDHRAAVRPATLERRPFVGFHPHLPSVGILNGMGTKGTSLAPFFAHQLVQNLVHDLPITPEADVHRFSRILSKG